MRAPGGRQAARFRPCSVFLGEQMVVHVVGRDDFTLSVNIIDGFWFDQ